jgi:hypothetical protein
VLLLLLLVLWTPPAWCDLHHHLGSGHPDAPPDPLVDAFVWGSLLIVAASLALLVIGGPLLFLWTRRIRDLFWAVPLANLLLYLLSIALRSHPGGRGARFHPPGLWYTIAEVVLLVLSSLVVASILAAIRWLFRKFRPPREAASRAGT